MKRNGNSLFLCGKEAQACLGSNQLALREREDTPKKGVGTPIFFIETQTWARSAPRLLGKFTKSQSYSKCQTLLLSCSYLLRVDSNSGPLKPLKTSPRPPPWPTLTLAPTLPRVQLRLSYPFWAWFGLESSNLLSLRLDILVASRPEPRGQHSCSFSNVMMLCQLKTLPWARLISKKWEERRQLFQNVPENISCIPTFPNSHPTLFCFCFPTTKTNFCCFCLKVIPDALYVFSSIIEKAFWTYFDVVSIYKKTSYKMQRIQNNSSVPTSYISSATSWE